MTAFSTHEVWHFFWSSISFHTEVNGTTEKQQKARQIKSACHNGFVA